MQNRWDESQAREQAEGAVADGLPEALGLRVYSSRLLGQDPDLVLHGGGNTSVKIDGEEGPVLHVKGSGWDLARIEAPGLPGLRLEPLLEAAHGPRMSDERMTAFLRENLLLANAPDPSVETLLHAFIPHRFVDHSHATAILVLADQPDMERRVREIYGTRLAFVPYVMPGFDLSVACDRAFRNAPGCEGLWLERHGLFTFAETAKGAYDRMIDFVNAAEDHLGDHDATVPGPQPDDRPEPAALSASLRDALRSHGGLGPEPALDFRSTPAIRAYVGRDDIEALSRRGTATPDHVIRVKPFPLVLDGDDDAKRIAERLESYAREYTSYFERNARRADEPKTMLDTAPRVALVPGQGLYGLGTSFAAARICTDLMEQTARVVNAAESYGRFTPIEEPDLFDMEYWSLEQAKLARG